MRIILRTLIVCVSVILSGVGYSAANYYVSSANGNDGFVGTSTATPWKTLARANQVTCQPGDTIFLECNSRWVEPFTCKGNGDSLNNIVLTSYGNGRKPRLEKPGAAGVIVHVDAVNYWTINNLELSNAEWGIWLDCRDLPDKKGITIENCFFNHVKLLADFNRSSGVSWGDAILNGHMYYKDNVYTNGYDQIVIRNCISHDCDGFYQVIKDNFGAVTIEGCTIKGSSCNTVRLVGNWYHSDSSFNIIRNCVFMDNGGSRQMPWGGTDVEIGAAKNVIIEDCEFGNRRAFPGDGDGCAIDFEYTTNNAIVRRCDFHGCNVYAVMFYQTWAGGPSLNIGIEDCLFRYNANATREYPYEIFFNRADSMTGPIRGNTYYLLPGIVFTNSPSHIGVTFANNVQGTKSHVATPIAFPLEGTYPAIPVTITCATQGAVIHYTTDGSYPKTTSPVYTGPIRITETTAINAKAFKDGMEQSYGLSNIYVIDPTLPVLDTTLPGIPTGLTAPVTESRRVVLSWGAATDNESGISGYVVYRDGIADTTVSVTTAAIGNLSGGTDYRFSVAAVNNSPFLIEGLQTTELLVTTRADTPCIVYVTAIGDSTLVTITFSEPVEETSAINASNYAIDNGVAVLSALLAPDLSSVQLRTSPLSKNVSYVLTVNNIRDRSALHNQIPSDSRAEFMYHILPKVLNPSFESPSVPDYQYGTVDTAWIYNGSSGIVHNGSGFRNYPAPDGVQAVFLQNISSVTQSITIGSGKYRVRFKAAQRYRENNIQTVKVYLDDMELGSFTPPGYPASTSFAEYATDYLTVADGSYQLKIAGTASSGDNTVFVDEVAIEISGLSTDNEPAVIRQEGLSLAASPNPFNPSVNIQVAGWRSGTELRILNVSGKVVADLTKVLNSGTGQQRVLWNAAGQASGVYLVMLRQGKTELKRKVIMIR